MADSRLQPILWKRHDLSGLESSRIRDLKGERRLEGVAVFDFEGAACRLDYDIRCSSAWLTREATITGWVGARSIRLAIVRLPNATWTLNGQPQPGIEGCDDIDLNFSPSTNLLPIRRLDLAIGASARVRAAWLRFPGLVLQPLQQSYSRVDANHYRYRAGSFEAVIEVDDEGQVVEYAEWSRMSLGETNRS